MSASRYVIILLVLLAALQSVHYAPLLPDPMPTHFGDAGQPDESTPKTQYLLINFAAILGMAILFLVLPRAIRKIPNDWINMPRKDYWLAPEKRTETMNALQRQMEWLGAATIALLIGITQLTILAALSSGPLDSQALLLLFILYGLYAAIWTVRFTVWATRRPARDSAGYP